MDTNKDMNLYLGTKQILAKPMTRQEYNTYRNWTLPGDEDGTEEGYLVEYLDGGKPNHQLHKNYISWSPKEQFEKAYRCTNGLSFGLALDALVLGNRVCRSGWNGKSMWLVYVAADQYNLSVAVLDKCGVQIFPDLPELCPWIGLKTADNKVISWNASQADMLATDWTIL